MYQLSQTLQAAIAAKNPQRALIEFIKKPDGTAYSPVRSFSNEDLLVTNGLRLTEEFNSETDLTIGLCPSAQIQFDMLNDAGQLANFEFGTFKAYLGARIDGDLPSVTVTLTPADFTLYESGHVVMAESAVVVGGDPAKAIDQMLSGWSVYSYDFGRNAQIKIDAIEKNGNIQGVIPVAIHSNSGYTYYAVDTDRIGQEFTGDKILINKLESVGFVLNTMTVTYTLSPSPSGKTKTFTEDGETVLYEFAPLGTFIAKRPDIVKKKIISVDANDQMTLFDEDMLKLTVSYPITLANLARAICNYAGVSLKANSWLNSAIIVQKEPKQFESSTMREVMGWIAEAACSNARFNRDGLLEFFWFNTTGRTYDETDYAEFTPTWYATHAIDGLHIRNADSTEELIIGQGDNAYMIQDNPFLRQSDERPQEE